jgi:hypothetical protein
LHKPRFLPGAKTELQKWAQASLPFGVSANPWVGSSQASAAPVRPAPICNTPRRE